MDSYIDFEHSCFVFSDAHYRDILLGDKQKYQRKIQTLYFLSKGWKIIDSPQNINQLMLGNIENIEEDFNTYKENCAFSQTNLVFPKELFDTILNFDTLNKNFSSETINSYISFHYTMKTPIFLKNFKNPLNPHHNLNEQQRKHKNNQRLYNLWITFKHKTGADVVTEHVACCSRKSQGKHNLTVNKIHS